MAEELALQLDCPISWDHGDGSVANHNQALRIAAQVEADWYLVIEDDAEPIAQFYDQAAAALSTAPIGFASLYYGYVGVPDCRIRDKLAARDPNWYVIQGWANTVCVAVRADQVVPLLDTAAQIEEELPSDHHWGEAARRLGEAWIPHSYPSLVQHKDGPSLIAGQSPRGFRRRAYKVGGREQWTGTTL